LLLWEVKVAPVRHEHVLKARCSVGLDNSYMHIIGYLVECLLGISGESLIHSKRGCKLV
jgi:hypothetical protein